MLREKQLMTGCLLAALMAAQPAMALSEMGKRAHQHGDTITAEGVAEGYALPASLQPLIPGLIGHRLYLRLLQSDEYITLEGLTGAFWDKHIIKMQ